LVTFARPSGSNEIVMLQPGSTRIPRWVPYFNAVARRLLAAGLPLGPDVLMTGQRQADGEAAYRARDVV
jgi:hypothetical protein